MCKPQAATAATTTAPAGAADFEAAIARLEQFDPQAPQALNARLEYADFLTDPPTGPATTGDCHARLDAAQAQLDVLAAQPAVNVLLPQGPARLANDVYNIHAARAECDAAQRDHELTKALDAARWIPPPASIARRWITSPPPSCSSMSPPPSMR